ncbi:uncharacterized protein LOC126899611 [Daktulosphaira vitifoliae]|uniref:uncharacterized protein LOC126899611 n=1 Tax=Daktulosphaira vitifoliae TaxID=58002 RepID=UPI0021A9ECD8|nr:uncharacterized protein LOC126899611 [Daktulosphaira vitifoliae]
MLSFKFLAIIKLWLYVVIILVFSCIKTTAIEYWKLSYNPKHLKCFYLFGALTHMKITKIMLTRDDYMLSTVISNISMYNENVKKQISTIYDIDKNNIGTLWLINIYSHSITWYLSSPKVRRILNRNDKEFVDIVKTHEFIIAKMEDDNKNCNKYNIIYTAGDNFKEYSNEDKHFLDSLLLKNYENMKNFITINQNQLVINYNRFSKPSIFIRSLGPLLVPMRHFKNDYYVYVTWNKEKNIETAFIEAHVLNWSSDKLQSIKVYYKVFFNTLKIIMLRLTWKHFLYLQCQKFEFIQTLAKQWISKLHEFSQLTCVKNDDDIIRIIFHINSYIDVILKYKNGLNDMNNFLNYNKNFFTRLISDLHQILTELCLTADCFATEPMFLFGEELPKIKKPPHDPTDVATVEHYSLNNADMFLRNIKVNSKKTDYEVVRYFISYIDELYKHRSDVIKRKSTKT